MGYWDNFQKNKPTTVSTSEASSKFDFFNQSVDSRELIHPRLSRFDKEDLWSFIRKEIIRHNQVSGNQHIDELTEDKIPKFMVYDVYNKYFTTKQDMVISKPTEQNQWLYDFIIDKLDNYYTKPITESNLINSAIFTSEVIKQLLILNKNQNPDGAQGSGEGNSQIEKTLSGASNYKLQQAIQNASENASQKVEQMEQMKNEVDTSDSNTGGQGGNGASKGESKLDFHDLNNIQDFYDLLQNVKFDDTTMANFFKDTLKMSTAYFGSKYKEYEEGLLDADDVDMLEGLENLLPQLKNLHLDDVVTYNRKYHLKFDVFVDTSGSMGSLRTRGSRAMLAKVVALKLHKLGLVDNFYCFDTSVTKPMKGLRFLKSHSGGGTDLDRVVKEIIAIDRPSLIITDACDSLSVYTEKAYWVGVPGSSFCDFGGYYRDKNSEHECDNYFSNGQLALMRKDGTLAKVTSRNHKAEY